MIDSDYIKSILGAPVYEQLKSWYEATPTQQAALDEFVAEIVIECYYVLHFKHNIQVSQQLREHWKL